MVLFLLASLNDETKDMFDWMRYCFLWLPSFCVTQGLVYASSLEFLEDVSNNVNSDLYRFENLPLNMYSMAFMAVFSTIILIIFESGCCNCCAGRSMFSVPKTEG